MTPIHGKACSCARCWADREARDFAEHERRVARRRRWKPALGSIWTGRRSAGSFGLVLRDPSEPGSYRVQLFDGRGMQGHRTRRTLGEIAELLHQEFGPRLRAMPAGTLDKVAAGWGEA